MYKVILMICLALPYVWVTNRCAEMLSSSSDIGVVGGFLGFIVLNLVTILLIKAMFISKGEKGVN